MPTHISLLRGVNVAGRTVRMAELQRIYDSLGFKNIQTYLQSGNVLFESGRADAEDLARQIESAIKKSLGHTVSVLIRSPRDLRRIFGTNPFLQGRREDPSKLHVTFLESLSSRAALAGLTKPPGETGEFIAGAHEIFLFCPDGYGRTKVNNAFFERKLKTSATTRNWNTVVALFELANQSSA